MKIVFDDAAEYQDALDMMELSGNCPGTYGLKETECSPWAVIQNARDGKCRICWDNALKEIAEVRHHEDHI